MALMAGPEGLSKNRMITWFPIESKCVVMPSLLLCAQQQQILRELFLADCSVSLLCGKAEQCCRAERRPRAALLVQTDPEIEPANGFAGVES